MHRTLKQTLSHPPAANLKAQQIQLDGFRPHYKGQSPHEGLAQQSPSTCYTPSLRSYPARLPDLEYPGYFERQRVSQNGLIYWRALRVYIGYLLAGEWVGMEPVADGLWDVYFGPVRIGGFDERETKGQRNDYLTLKL